MRKSNKNNVLVTISPSEFIFSGGELALSAFLSPYIKIQEQIEKEKQIEEEKRLKEKEEKAALCAYKVTFDDIPDLFFISFEKGHAGRDKARGKALMYLREFHPRFISKGWIQEFRVCHRRRCPQFDKYWVTQRVPIPELMKEGMVFPCTICGKDRFTYEDYESKRCFYVQGENHSAPFVDGFVLCYNCYKKYLA